MHRHYMRPTWYLQMYMYLERLTVFDQLDIYGTYCCEHDNMKAVFLNIEQ